AQSYVARRKYTGGSIDSAAFPITALDLLAPDAVTSATLKAWWRTPDSLQYGTTLLHTAGTGPAVTLSGTLTPQSYGWEVRIKPTGGTRGTATYEIEHH